MYWQLIMRSELGLFQLALFLFGSALGALLLWLMEIWILRTKAANGEPRPTPSAGTWARLPLYGVLAGVALLSIADLGRPVGGLVVFDEQGLPQRATMQVIVRVGGKIKSEHVVLRAIGDDGSTRALHRVGYANGRTPLQRSAAFWDRDGETLRSTETLEVLATAADARTLVPELEALESRLLHVADDGRAVFQRRDGVEVRVDPADIIEPDSLGVAGCLLDASRPDGVKAPELIKPRSVPWAQPGPGCPTAPPPGTELLVSDDAAFGEVRPLLTLRDDSGRRWQHALSTITGSDDPVLIGAAPFMRALTVVSADGDELVFSRLDWDDGATIDTVRW